MELFGQGGKPPCPLGHGMNLDDLIRPTDPGTVNPEGKTAGSKDKVRVNVFFLMKGLNFHITFIRGCRGVDPFKVI